MNMKETKKCLKFSLEKSKELTTDTSKISLKLKLNNPLKGKSAEISEQSKSSETLKEKSKELSSERSKKLHSETSYKRSRHQSTHVDDVDILNNLMGAALDKANNYSEVQAGENDTGGYKEIDENDDDSSEDYVRERGETSKMGKTRVLTKLLDIFKTKKVKKVNFNEHEQPDSDKSAKLGSFLGLIARNGQVASLNFVDWRSMHVEFKNIQWHIVLQHFKIPLEGKKWVMKSLGRKWCNFKSLLKREHYVVHDNDVDRFADRDPRVHPEHWKFLVKYWSSDKGKERCLKNKDSRKKQKLIHTTSRKSFARVRKEMKNEFKKEPKRHELFIRTHTRKNGEPLDVSSKVVIDLIGETVGHYPHLVEKEAAKDDLLGVML